MKIVYKKHITLQEVRDAKPKMIYYSVQSCWWTHDPAHLSKTGPLPEHYRTKYSDGSGLPCDPTGGVLMQTDNVEGFLRSAEENSTHYGKHGLDAFMAAHHLNIRNLTLNTSWSLRGWKAYNDLIDEALNTED